MRFKFAVANGPLTPFKKKSGVMGVLRCSGIRETPKNVRIRQSECCEDDNPWQRVKNERKQRKPEEKPQADTSPVEMSYRGASRELRWLRMFFPISRLAVRSYHSKLV